MWVPLEIQSWFGCLPANRVSNIEIAESLGHEDLNDKNRIASSILKHTGIAQRRYAQSHQAASDLASAAIKPLECDGADIFTLILATTSPDVPSPATAHWVHRNLAWPSHIHCFDVMSSCSSFLSALRAASGFLEENKKAVVIASEVKHRGLAPHDLRTRSLFADGSAGVVLSANKRRTSGLKFAYANTLSTLADRIVIPVGGSREPTSIENIHRNVLHIHEPKNLFIQTVNEFKAAVESCWEQRNKFLMAKNVDPIKISGLIYLHQANANILWELKSRLVPEISCRIPVLMSDVGNMVCASLPMVKLRSAILENVLSECDVARSASLLDFKLILNEALGRAIVFNKDLNSYCYSVKSQFETLVLNDLSLNSKSDCKNTFVNSLSDIELDSFRKAWINGRSISEHNCNKSVDILIAAGGGFQTLGFLSQRGFEI